MVTSQAHLTQITVQAKLHFICFQYRAKNRQDFQQIRTRTRTVPCELERAKVDPGVLQCSAHRALSDAKILINAFPDITTLSTQAYNVT